eukprot:scaffold137931_cov36-Tisochrysis_lutea.AAC.6
MYSLQNCWSARGRGSTSRRRLCCDTAPPPAPNRPDLRNARLVQSDAAPARLPFTGSLRTVALLTCPFLGLLSIGLRVAGGILAGRCSFQCRTGYAITAHFSIAPTTAATKKPGINPAAIPHTISGQGIEHAGTRGALLLSPQPLIFVPRLVHGNVKGCSATDLSRGPISPAKATICAECRGVTRGRSRRIRVSAS